MQGSAYKVTVEEAKKLVANRNGNWDGRNRVKLIPDRNIGCKWAVRQSGYAGPLVLQVTT